MCTPGDTKTQACGASCGSQTSTCTDQCLWGAFDECSTTAICTPGSTQLIDCGFCGTQAQLCTTECQWANFGICENAGVCAQGDIQPCGDLCGEQVCNNQCQWLACNDQGVCAPGSVQYGSAAGCIQCEQKMCSAKCAWSGGCVTTSESECSAGEEQSCDGGQPGFKVCVPQNGGPHCDWTGCIDFKP